MLSASNVHSGFNDALPWPSLTATRDGKISYANRAFRTFVNTGGDTPIEHCKDWLKIEDAPATDSTRPASPLEELFAQIADGEGWHGHLLVLTNGIWTPCEFIIQTNLEDPDQLCIFSTESPTLNNRTLLSSKSELRLLQIVMDNSLDFLFFKDQEQRYVIVNRAYQKFLSVDYPGYAVGRKIEDFASKNTSQLVTEVDAKVMESGEPRINHEHEFTFPDGRSFWLQSTKVPVANRMGRCVGLVCIARDVTQEIRRQKDLTAARDAAERANRAKSQFLANMSHEIRTPINGIIGMAELCQDTKLTPDQLSFVETILLCSNSLLSLVNEALDFSKIEAGRFSLDHEPFDFVQTLEDSASAFCIQASGKGIEVNLDIEPAVRAHYIGDEKRLRQVVYNLLGNATKFTEEGEICLSARQIGEVDGRDKLLVIVSDTGIGIPSGNQNTIFESFTQVDMSTTRKYEGSGLGLSICREFVAFMGGHIFVCSQPGHPTQFAFYVLLDPDPEHPEPSGADFQHPKPLRTLIAHRPNRTAASIENCLQHHAFPVATAEDLPTLHSPKHRSAEEAPELYILEDQIALSPDLSPQIIEALNRSYVIIVTYEAHSLETQLASQIKGAATLSAPVTCKGLSRAIDQAISQRNEPQQITSPAVTGQQDDSASGEVPCRVLLVEDNKINQHVAAQRLKRRGFEVHVADHGDRAVDMFKETVFDFILMDIQMPVKDGFAATKEIRALEEHSPIHTPIIAMTARALRGDREECLAAGMDYYLAKPFRVASFEEILNQQRLMEIVTGNRKLRAELENAEGAPQTVAQQVRTNFLSMDTEDREDLTDAAFLFLQHNTSQMQALSEAAQIESCRDVRHLAHALKGAVAIFGAQQIVDRLQTIENKATEESASEIQELIEDVRPQIQILAETLETYVNSDP